MKKITRLSALCAAAVFAFSSCNKDDDYNFDLTPSKTAYVSSNTSGMVTMLEVKDLPNVMMSQKNISSMDADGIYYNKDRKEIILASRTTNRVEIYQQKEDGMLEIKTTSTADFTNAREIAVSGNMIVVAQDADPALNNNMNRLYVYERTPSGVRMRNVYDVNINLWGIHAEGNTLYAVVDNSSSIVAYENFFSNPSGSIEPTKRVSIEGLGRTHGITYSKADNRMVLTDIGDAASDSDGAIVVINNFMSTFMGTQNGGIIGSSKQIRIEGSSTMLGNPVDVAYDSDKDNIYVAERANGGGKVLIFKMPMANGNPSPAYSASVAGASSIYLQQ